MCKQHAVWHGIKTIHICTCMLCIYDMRKNYGTPLTLDNRSQHSAFTCIQKNLNHCQIYINNAQRKNVYTYNDRKYDRMFRAD